MRKYILLFSLLISLCFCGGDGEDESLKVKKRTEQVSLSEIKTSKSTEKILKITDVEFSKLIDVENDITATPLLSDKKAEKEFDFRWFVNDREVRGRNTSTLSREFFDENDWVYCRVRINDEDWKYHEFVSGRVQIKGALPVLVKSDSEKFTLPGIFRYKINAHMPEINDLEPEYSDEEEIDPDKSIKYELISPLDKGIVLDTLTGELSWDITEELITELGDNITIKFSIISPSGRKINSSITITLKEGENANSNSNNGSTLGSEIE